MDFGPTVDSIDPAWFRDPDGIHGVAHAFRVGRLAARIADLEQFDEKSREALDSAARWHDIGRIHNSVDDGHGARSVAKVRALGLDSDLPSDLVELALFAVEYHSRDDREAMLSAEQVRSAESKLSVLWALKDADALDRVRFTVVSRLNPRFLRFESSIGLAGYATELFAGT